ncbi:DUF664 domain-containing protein [Kribbella sp. HUAS MG21]|uniref:DUF664 domain-containing protein n=1 Tax=Kribbella sp. HUAS MG21 TaxID=3160966 RepID=A0AAU7TF46_9ACTN
MSLRWIYLHMIEETAQHRGHLDLLLDAVRQARSGRSPAQVTPGETGPHS